MPENQTGARFLLKIWFASCLDGVIGMREGGSSRFGKYEMSGVPGGGNMSENSGASEDKGVCFVERATIRLVLSFRREISDCGVMSFPKSVDDTVSLCSKVKKKAAQVHQNKFRTLHTFSFRGEDDDMCKRSFVVLDYRRCLVLGYSEGQFISLVYIKLELCLSVCDQVDVPFKLSKNMEKSSWRLGSTTTRTEFPVLDFACTRLKKPSTNTMSHRGENMTAEVEARWMSLLRVTRHGRVKLLASNWQRSPPF